MKRENIVTDVWNEYQKGVEILDIAAKYNEELLQKAEEFAGKWVSLKKPKLEDKQKDELILGLMRKMISFNQSLDKEVLTQDEADLLHDIVNGKQENDYDNQQKVTKYLTKLDHQIIYMTIKD